MKFRFIVVAAVLGCIVVPQVRADSFSATFPNFAIQVFSSQPIAISIAKTFGPGCAVNGTPNGSQGSVNGTAVATPGILGGASQATLNVPNGCFFPTGSLLQEFSAFTMTGITLSGPPGTQGKVVPFSFNVRISGAYGVGASNPTYGGLVLAGASWGCNSGTGGSGGSLGTLASTGSATTASGIFSSGSAQAGAGSCGAFVGENDISISLQLSTQASVQSFPPNLGTPGSAIAFVNYAHALGLSTIGPVFNLPPGYTVSSADGAILNNQFMAMTPEPATVFLFASGLVAAGLTRNRFR